jgi:hypothetical protein
MFYCNEGLIEQDYRPIEDGTNGGFLKQSYVKGDIELSDLSLEGYTKIKNTAAEGKLNLQNVEADRIDIINANVISVDLTGAEIECLYVEEPSDYVFNTDEETLVEEVRSVRDRETRGEVPWADIYEIGLEPVYKDRKQNLKEIIPFAQPRIEFRGVEDQDLNDFVVGSEPSSKLILE